MSNVITYQRFWMRRDTSANWTAANPVLAAGEWGVELPAASGDLARVKMGDGATAWNDLGYIGEIDLSDVDQRIADAITALRAETDPFPQYATPAEAAAAAPVQSVNGQTGNVELNAGDVGAATAAQGALADSAMQPGDAVSSLANDAGYVDAAGASAAAPVQSVVGQTGDVSAAQIKAAVSYTASDVGADPAGSAAAAQAAAQAYADGKVVDSIADGDTARAPSRNAVFDALAVKANDSAVVHTNGDETINGAKTFTSQITNLSQSNIPTTSPNWLAQRARAGGTAILSGDRLSGFFFGGHNGTTFNNSAAIEAYASENYTSSTAGSELRFAATPVGGASRVVRWTLQGAGHWVPASDNAFNLGSGSFRLKEIFCANGTINTSDAREKSEVRAFTPAEIAAASQIVRELGIFQWLESLNWKGDDARLHTGATVQRVIEILQGHGLDPFRYGFICFDEWDEQPEIWSEWDAQEEVRDEAGEVIQPAVEAGRQLVQEYRPAGSRYGFRHDQLALFLLRGLAARQDALEARLAALEA